MWPWLALGLILAAAVCELRSQARIWWCACGQLKFFAGDIWSAHNSQHVFDPYSFTHVLHGLVFYGIIARLFPRVSLAWRFCVAIGLEALWEVFENTQFIIQRYREATIGLGYEGDSIVNSLGDVLFCSIGFGLARCFGLRWSLVLFVATELALLFWVRDNLTLNILMLIYPLAAIKSWQMIH
ncbi:MAG: DUF2585 family protein [Lentisphaerae bacterium]|nr:DUF2585 family protein [Lentisphaerota bacterium]